MTASEDPAPTTPAAGSAAPRDDLEHWLSDLRTDVAEDPPGWIDAGHPGAMVAEDPPGWIDAGHHGEMPAPRPPDAEPVPHGQAAASASRPNTVGRHRSPD